MTATQKISILRYKLINQDITLSFDEVRSLRKDEMILHRWAEAECNGDIERDENTNRPYRVIRPYNGPDLKSVCPDRETAAIKRISAICEKHSLHFFHQTDPRGCSLYISKEPMESNNYSRGVAICD
jgi:hypothetical protein